MKNSKLDVDLLENGDTRNVVDKYRNWTNEAIKDDLKQHAFPFHIAIENYQHDFNIGTIVRNANAFNAAGVHIVGKHKWNRRGAMVTDKYLQLYHHPDVKDFTDWTISAGLRVIGIDNITGSVELHKADLPEKSILVFGQEGPGLSPEMQAICEKIIGIEQFGSTRSVNVGVASGIIMYQWVCQHKLA
ncbi:MAG TPA: TrmH family RNA methyltransferase [Candidatus Saccharimonadales bacterium]|nr:TrmH family RNA methyltransferase [Candidatus Saccharimonadales bacterium]